MKILESLKGRRSYYDINKNLPVDESEVFDLVEKATELVPDAFNMKSSRVIVVTGEKQDQLWDNIYEVFDRYVWRVKKIWKSGTGIFQTAPWRTMIWYVGSRYRKAYITLFVKFWSGTLTASICS